LLVNAIMALDNGASAEVVTGDGTSDEIKLSVGVLQGDTLAPYLFDFVIDDVLRNATEKQTPSMVQKEPNLELLSKVFTLLI
jgi:hypothetical protein